jgi:hypothetical protein
MRMEQHDTAPALGTLSAAIGGLAATLVTAMACVGPLVAIVLGIGGFGWLTRYAYLRVPATAATAVLLLVGFYLAYTRRVASCGDARKRRALRVARAALWLAAVVAVVTNVFEYLIFPNL